MTKINKKNGISEAQITIVENFISKHYKVRYNVVSNEIEFCNADNKEWRQLNENNIYRRLKKSYTKCSLSDLRSLLRSDFVTEFDPLKSYFENLPKWNGTDYIGKLAEYFTLLNPEIDTDRFKRMLRKHFIRAVACSIGAKWNKHCFVLVGERQNMGKTSFWRWTVPPELIKYYSEDFNPNQDKDAAVSLGLNFLINLDELSTLSKADIKVLKAVLSKSDINVRLPYDARFTHMKRRSTFVASTNETEFLTDETGNVRWLCFAIVNINFDYRKDIDINNIWAQAYALYNQNEAFELTPAEIQENEVANRLFMTMTPEKQLIAKYYELGNKEHPRSKFMTASDILTDLNVKTDRQMKLNTNNIGKALKGLGFSQISKRVIGDMPIKGYYITDKLVIGYDETPNNAVRENEPQKSGIGDLPF